KRQPLADADPELSFALEFLVYQEIIPAGVVLDARESPGGSFGEREFVSLAPLGVSGLGNHVIHRVPSTFPQNSRGVSLGVPIDFAARRVRRVPSDFGGF